MTVIRLLARPMLASTFVFGGINSLRNAQSHAEAAKPVNDQIRETAAKVAPSVPVPDDDVTLVRINAVVHVAAGLALATGRMPRLAAWALAGTLLPTTVAGHPFWAENDDAEKREQMGHFFKNVSMLGGLVIAALDTEGRPGVAWRAKNTLGTARRETQHLRRHAGQQARLASKSVTS